MKLNSNFIKHTIDDQTVVVPTAGADFHGLVQGNKSVEVILECLENDTTEEAITEESTFRPSSTTAAAVSSQDDSMAKILIPLPPEIPRSSVRHPPGRLLPVRRRRCEGDHDGQYFHQLDQGKGKR